MYRPSPWATDQVKTNKQCQPHGDASVDPRLDFTGLAATSTEFLSEEGGQDEFAEPNKVEFTEPNMPVAVHL